MEIAIIGGGASGLAAAHYLSRNGHRVSLFERAAQLGGHIRTVNRNVLAGSLAPSRYLEAGVVEFSSAFTQFEALMAELDVPLQRIEVGTAMFRRDGRRYLSRGMIKRNAPGLAAVVERARLERLIAGAVPLWLRSHGRQLEGRPLADCLRPGQPRDTWLRLLTMYCYSTPYAAVGGIPAGFALPPLRRYMWRDWKRMPGGVSSYVDRIVERLNGEVVVSAGPVRAVRSARGVALHWPDGRTRRFDKLVLAAPPDQVLALLADPRPDEQRWFAPWRANHITTTVHSDGSLYERYGIARPSEFDFFETGSGWGYNACLNQICGLTGATRYFLAFGLDDAIAPERVVARVAHHTPHYDVAALRSRRQVIACNGFHHTYHAGAWLYDGLHEGAIRSGRAVADLIGPAG